MKYKIKTRINALLISLSFIIYHLSFSVALSSCSDFEDYNEAVRDVIPSANRTLWENIQQRPELTDFAALVKRAGFDDELNATEYYTVWAPVNGSFNPADYSSLTDDALLKQFVKNHIARYSFPASGTVSERVMMLNEKSYDFTGAPAYVMTENPASLDDIREILQKKYEERYQQYASIADIIIDIKNAPIEENFKTLLGALDVK